MKLTAVWSAAASNLHLYTVGDVIDRRRRQNDGPVRGALLTIYRI